jgi:DNA-binding GntR family transcriptional regulator
MQSFLTKSQVAYENIKDFIISGIFQPGDKLVLSDIAARLEMSEIPVREALIQLEAESYVNSVPHVGFRVTELTAKETKEVYVVRIALEKLAADLAFPNISPSIIDRLVKLNVEIGKCIEEDRSDQYWRLNKQFHEILYSPCENEVLLTLINQMGSRSGRTRAIFKVKPERAVESHQEHEFLLSKLGEGDKAGFVEGIGNHLINALNAILASHLVRD